MTVPPFDPHTNFAVSTVLVPPSPASSGTTLGVATGDGALFPDPATDGEFNVVVWPAGEQPNSTNAEICRATNLSGDSFTITRQQEGSAPRAILAGDFVALAITAKVLTDIEDATTNLPANNETDALTLEFPDVTDPVWDNDVIAALHVVGPANPSTRNFACGIVVDTQSDVVDKGRGMLIRNDQSRSDGHYVGNNGGGVGYATDISDLVAPTGNSFGFIGRIRSTTSVGLLIDTENPGTGIGPTLARFNSYGTVASELVEIGMVGVAAHTAVTVRNVGGHASAGAFRAKSSADADVFAVNAEHGHTLLDSAAIFAISDATMVRLGPDVLAVGSSGDRKAIHRHPFTGLRHIEAGRTSLGAAPTTASATFASAFQAAPIVTAIADVLGGVVFLFALTTTGVTFKNDTWGAMAPSTINWIAEGPDA